MLLKIWFAVYFQAWITGENVCFFLLFLFTDVYACMVFGYPMCASLFTTYTMYRSLFERHGMTPLWLHKTMFSLTYYLAIIVNVCAFDVHRFSFASKAIELLYLTPVRQCRSSKRSWLAKLEIQWHLWMATLLNKVIWTCEIRTWGKNTSEKGTLFPGIKSVLILQVSLYKFGNFDPLLVQASSQKQQQKISKKRA